jgi:hypothetical protein
LTTPALPELAATLLSCAARRVSPDPQLRLPARSLTFLSSRGILSLATNLFEGSDEWEEACDRVWSIQQAATGEAVAALDAVGIRPIVLKGAELVRRFRGSSAVDVGGDIDLLVRRGDLDETKAVLYSLGYRQSEFSPESGSLVPRDVAAIGQMEATHYELAPFRKLVPLPPGFPIERLEAAAINSPVVRVGEAISLVVEIDVHHNVAADTEPEGLFARAVASVWPGAMTLSMADHLWVNLSRNYVETAIHGKCSLRPFAYTLPIIAAEAVDWDMLVSEARALELGPTLYYPLATFARLLPDTIPDEVIERVRRTAPNSPRDWGWQLARPFGFDEKFPSYALGRD